MVRMYVRLTRDQVRALKVVAAREGRSVAELIREGIDDLLQKSTGVSVDERRRRAIAAIGRFHSGRSDISTNHDDHLADLYGAA